MSKFSDSGDIIRLAATKAKAYAGGPNQNVVAETAFGDVVKVIHDNDNRSIGAINVNIKTKDRGVLNVTMTPLSPHMYTVPVPNEKVVCIRDPRFGKRWYYMGIASDGAMINHIALADSKTYTKGDVKELYPGETFKPYPYSARAVDTIEGDVVIQGRFGQSLRMSSTNDKVKFPWRNNRSKSQTPITILRTGQLPIENMLYDASSLYLTFDQHIPLPLKSPMPDDIGDMNRYDHSQCILYSDRIVLGTRLNEIVLNSREKIHLVTGKWKHDVDSVLDFVEDIVAQLKELNTMVRSQAFASQWQTFVIPGLGTTANSTRIGDFGQVYSKTFNFEQQVTTMEETLKGFKQKQTGPSA